MLLGSGLGIFGGLRLFSRKVVEKCLKRECKSFFEATLKIFPRTFFLAAAS